MERQDVILPVDLDDSHFRDEKLEKRCKVTTVASRLLKNVSVMWMIPVSLPRTVCRQTLTEIIGYKPFTTPPKRTISSGYSTLTFNAFPSDFLVKIQALYLQNPEASI
jgi:hypothetical protein